VHLPYFCMRSLIRACAVNLEKILTLKLGLMAQFFLHGILEYAPGVITWRMTFEDDSGGSYCGVRGEILGPLQDELMRKRSTMAFLSIKNESKGIEDDRRPS